MQPPRKPGPVPPGGLDPLPTEAEIAAQFERALLHEGRPFFALTGVEVASARWSEHSIWPEGERGDESRAFRSLVIRYGDDVRWAKVGTWFGQHPKNDPSDAHRESMISGDMAFQLGLEAAEPGDGEAYSNREAMEARIRAAQEQARSVTASTLVINGEAIAAFTAKVGRH
ncbi:MAG: hypothetical protein Q7T55_25535, partial [Solirubrobacteraceae bacterium]|nr:hypothetical protein [Solirubrobacteraceae bacterium]